jgi:hypothetical protein
VPRRSPYGITISVPTSIANCSSYIHMKYTTFVYEMICITKRFVTFNKYTRNFNFHNEMNTTATLTPLLRRMKHTRHAHIYIYLCVCVCVYIYMYIYKMKSVTRKRCSLLYTYRRYCGSTIEMKITPHKKTDVPR